MTVNERLFAAGLLDRFHEAMAQRNTGELRAMLRQLGLPAYPVEQLFDLRRSDGKES